MPAVPESRYEEFAQAWMNRWTLKKMYAHFDCNYYFAMKVRNILDLPERQMWNHGASAYANYGCRCEVCTVANRVRVNRRRLERYKERPKDPDDPRHGSPSFYANHGCRCAECKLAYAKKNKADALRRKKRKMVKA